MAVNFAGDTDALREWLLQEFNDGINSRRSYDRMLDEWDRQYEQIPRVSKKVFPWDGASNLEVPVGATHVDTIMARLESAYFSTLPWVTVRCLDGKYAKHADALADYLNQVTLPNSGYRQEKAIDLLGMTKLGTSFQWLTYESDTRRVRGDNNKVIDHVVHEGPLQRFVHPRHLIVPPDARDIQKSRWVSIRSYQTWGEIIHNRNRKIYDAQAVANLDGRGITSTIDTRREARQGISRVGRPRVWENITTFALYQQDIDSEPEDLWINWNYPSGIIMRAIYNPYDHLQWPLSKSQYMMRESAFNGIGIMSMLTMIQEEITTIHNYCLDNLLAANTVVSLVKANTVKKFEIFPMSRIDYTGDKDSVRFERLGTALSGQQVGEAAANGYAERRTGSSEGNVNRMAPQRGLSGSRTPATTTLALLGESNKRFELAIENSKEADAVLLKQHVMLLRQFWLRQRVMAQLWHAQKARLIEQLLALPIDALRRNLIVEVAASTSAVNREVEKQNVLILSGYMREFYGLFLQFVKLYSEVQPLQPLIKKIIDGISAFAENLLRTFDIRDPEKYILRFDDIGVGAAAQPQETADELTDAFVMGTGVGATNGTSANGAGGSAVRA